MSDDIQYDVALSFAGEDRAYVQRVADALRASDLRVFYDNDERVVLWGKDLYEHLSWVYGRAARYCVMFSSEAYAKKLWTNHERRNAQERAFTEHEEYVLPVRFDDTPIPGLRTTVGFIDARETSPEDLASLIVTKVGRPERREYLPPHPDRLFVNLGVEDSEDLQSEVESHARSFLQMMRRTDAAERQVVLTIFSAGCPGDLPENVHISLDYLRRLIGKPSGEILEVVRPLASLGFTFELQETRDSHELDPGDRLLVLKWTNAAVDAPEGDQETLVAHAMVEVIAESMCEEHGNLALGNLDFSHLSSKAEPHAH